MRTNPEAIAALRSIAKKGGGLLVPEKIIEHARNEDSPLHNSFCWDDTDAAHQYRIYQARQLIRTTIQFIKVNGDQRACRVFVSLTPDREEESGGYREVVAVMGDKDMRRQLLKDALDEMQSFEKKYAHLKELAAIFVAAKKARETLL